MSTPDDTTEGAEEPIGQRIRRLRLERGLSLRNLASAGVSFTYLSRLENGNRTPSIHVIRALARELGVSTEYLEHGVDISTREQLELALVDAELQLRLGTGTEEAEQALRDLVEDALGAAEADIAAKAQAALGMAAFDAGRLRDALRYLEAAIQHPVMRPDVVPDVYMSLARVYRQLHRVPDEVRLCERALAEVHDDDGARRIVFATTLAHALAELGEVERAERVLEELEPDLDDADPYARSRLHWSLARLAAGQENRRLALRHMRSAIQLLKATEDTERIARAHMVCAEILLWGSKTQGVAEHLTTARALLSERAGFDSHGVLQGLEAILAAREHRYEDALQAAEESLQLLHEDIGEQVRPLYARALAAAGLGRYALADVSFESVVQLKADEKLWREAAGISEEAAAAREAAQDPDGARRWRRRAAAFAAKAVRERSRVRALV